MTADVENLVLEHSRALRGESSEIRSDIREIKSRLGSIETAVARVGRDLAHNYSEQVEDRHRIDALSERVKRIEQRLELVGE